MRILFDGFWWATGPASNRQVMREIIYEWLRQFPQDDVAVAVRRKAAVSARYELSDRAEIVVSRLWPQGLSAVLELPLLARRIRADLIVTHNFTPILGTSAVFIHDLMFVTNPEWFTRLERLYFALMGITARRADLVFTSTKTEARRIGNLTRTLRRPLPVGLGVPGALTADHEEPIRELADLDGFLLLVGRLNVRKNLSMAVEGALASGRVGPRFPIAIIGEAQGRAASFSEEVQAASVAGSVRFLGFVSAGELAWAYRNSSAFLFLSLDEGFGMPAIEALTFGAPIVASDIEVFHEVLGDRAVFACPDSAADIGRAVNDVLNVVAATGRPAPVQPEILGYTWTAVAHKIRSAINDTLGDPSALQRRTTAVLHRGTTESEASDVQ